MYFNAPQFLAYAQDNPSIRDEIIYLSTGRQERAVYDGLGRYILPPPVTLEQVETYLATKFDAIAARDPDSRAGEGTWKWHRPWDVVPELRDWSAPEGDFGVGVEVEMGFRTLDGARQVANHVRDWEYITLDYEGGDIPIEATFPPVPYSQFATSDAVRYVDYLKENEDLVVRHDPQSMIGTHINVSVGGQRLNRERVNRLSGVLSNLFNTMNMPLKRRYFGRHPYDTCFGQGYSHMSGEYRWVEFKLFNSQLDSRRLQQYADIAVSLVKLVMSEEDINGHTVHIALEEGYAIRGDIAANVSDAEQVALPLAA